MKLWRWPLLLILPVALFWLPACGPKFKEQEEDCGFVQNVYGERISWKSDVPIALSVHESFPSSYYPALEAAVKAWETAAGRPLFKIVSYGITNPSAPKQDGSSVIYLMNTWEANKASEQARTSVYWIGDQIKEADIKLNDHDFNFYTDNANSSADVHLESLLIHELGHVLGLKHKDGVSSVMDTYLSAMTIRDKVSTADASSLRCEY